MSAEHQPRGVRESDGARDVASSRREHGDIRQGVLALSDRASDIPWWAPHVDQLGLCSLGTLDGLGRQPPPRHELAGPDSAIQEPIDAHSWAAGLGDLGPWDVCVVLIGPLETSALQTWMRWLALPT